MSLRKILVQYLGSCLRLPELERDVTLITTDDGKRFVRERTCEVVGVRYDDMWDEYCIDLSCGCQLWQDNPEPPNYCEECGARIIERKVDA